MKMRIRLNEHSLMLITTLGLMDRMSCAVCLMSKRVFPTTKSQTIYINKVNYLRDATKKRPEDDEFLKRYDVTDWKCAKTSQSRAK